MKTKLFFLFLTLIYSIASSVNAGYLILKKEPCSSSEPCLKSVKADDAHADALYTIMINNTWPTAPKATLTGEAESEAQRLNNAIDENEALKGRYEFVWIPETLLDLSCGHTLLKEGKLTWDEPFRPLLPELKEKQRSSAETDRKFYYDSNEQVRNLLSAEPSALGLDEYFQIYNDLGKNAYFRCNQAFIDTLSTLSETPQAEVTKSYIKNIFASKDKRKNLRAIIAKNFADSVAIKNQNARAQIIGIREEEENLKSDTLLDRIIGLEIEANGRNEALLLRGTGGIPTITGDNALDYPLPMESRPTQIKSSSLSLAPTLYSGMFRESGPLYKSSAGKACPMNYINESSFGYAVTINRNDASVYDLFEIPRLGLIGRLFSNGEYWHARSKIGVLGMTDEELGKGVPGIFSSPTVAELKKLHFLVNENRSERDQAKAIANYIANHSVIVSMLGKPVEDSSDQVNRAKNAQLLLSERMASNKPEQLLELIDLLNRENKDIRAAASAELGWKYPRDENTLSQIAALLNGENKYARVAAIMTLNQLKPLSKYYYNLVVKRLADNSDEVRNMVIKFLDGLKPDEETLKIIVSMISNESKDIQESVIKALTTIGPDDEKIQRIVLQKLRDPSDKIRSAAAEFFQVVHPHLNVQEGLINVFGNTQDMKLLNNFYSIFRDIEMKDPKILGMLFELLKNDNAQFRSNVSRIIIQKHKDVFKDVLGKELFNALESYIKDSVSKQPIQKVFDVEKMRQIEDAFKQSVKT